MTNLADLTWPEVDTTAILAVPVGSTEQHGPHLPLSTDTDVALALCRRLADTREDVLIAPAVAYGSSGEHAGFAGTLSIGQAALELLLVELVRSATDTFRRVLLVSAHGGNAGTVTRAVSRLRGESRDVQVHLPRWEGEPHAGRTETAMLLELSPQRLRMDRAEAGDTRSLAELLPELQRGGVRAVAANGVLGDPRGATAAEGAALLDSLAADLEKETDGWWPR
jgi:mycofactocin precursor peptide peptidase